MLLSTCSFSDTVCSWSLILPPTSVKLKTEHLLLSSLCVSLDFLLTKPHGELDSAVQFFLGIHAAFGKP